MTLASSPRARPRLAVAASRCSAVSTTITGGRVLQHDDVPGLLAAEHVATSLHGLQDVPVAHRGLDHLDCCVLHGAAEAQIRHHRRDHRVTGQPPRFLEFERQDRQDLVAIDYLAVGGDRQAPVGVAVVRDTRVGTVAATAAMSASR